MAESEVINIKIVPLWILFS